MVGSRNWTAEFAAQDEERLALSARPAEDHLMRECQHPEAATRKQLTSNGMVQVFQQCQACGANASGFMRHAEVDDLDAVPLADPGLSDRWWAEFRAQRRGGADAARERQRVAYKALYDEYIGSPEWKARAGLVRLRAGHMCEGCREAPAQAVHHTTYAHLGAELLWELRAVCNACHARAHGIGRICAPWE
jgi:5-methylcytosine-specific restriction endonuclease McrA